MTSSPDIKTSEVRLPVDQDTIDRIFGYFQIWEMIDNTPLATALAYKIVNPNFKGRFETDSQGPERVLQIARNRRAAFKDSRFQVNKEDIYKNTAGDIFVPYIFLGIYQGDFLPKEAKGKSVAMHGVACYQLVDGKLLGLSSERNEEEMFQQLGVTRPDGQTNEF